MKGKVIWVVIKGEQEIIRVSRKSVANAIASEIGGYVSKYRTE